LAGNEVSDGASDVHGWALFAYGESRGYHKGLFRFSIEPSKRGEPLTSVKLLMRNVQKPRKPCITKPDNMHLISEIPEPAAYFAKDRTRWEATKEKVVFFCVCRQSACSR